MNVWVKYKAKEDNESPITVLFKELIILYENLDCLENLDLDS